MEPNAMNIEVIQQINAHPGDEVKLTLSCRR